MSALQLATVALAGPIMSLTQGLVAGWVYFQSPKQGLFRLFILWFSILGMFNFLGYLMTGPVFHNGDIGKALALFNTPMWMQIFIAILGAALLLLVAYHLTRPFLQFSFKEEWVNSASSRKNFSLYIMILPWLFGSAIMTLLYLPVVAIVSIIYPFTSGMVFIFPWQNARRIVNVPVSDNSNPGQVSYFTLICLILLVLVFRLILQPGIPI